MRPFLLVRRVRCSEGLARYALSTTHIGLALKRLITGFIVNQGPATLPYFANIGLPLNRDKDMIYIHSVSKPRFPLAHRFH